VSGRALLSQHKKRPALWAAVCGLAGRSSLLRVTP
jgi:hypothetical protein